jgi:acetyl-CoA carboxylase biotin carboxyl carrier protein
MSPDELKVYADFMKEYELTYLEVRRWDFRLVMGKKGERGSVEEFPAHVPSGEQILEESTHETQEVGNLIYVKSPLIGTFYRAPSPESDQFVELGTGVKKGDTLCIVEAMKVMNEIKSEHDGVIKEILVENNKPVEYGQVLFVIALP